MSTNHYKIYLIDSITGSTGNYAELDTIGLDLSNTFQVADLADISKRKDAITKTLTFQATKNNNIVFGNLSNLNRMVDDSINLSFLFNFNITKDIDCQVYENSTLIFTGKLHFIAANRDKQGNITYDCSIRGYLADFFSKINDKLIGDIDFTSFNHTYTIDNITNSWSNIYYKNGGIVSGATGAGYVYPFIDYGAGVTTDTSFDNKIDYRNFRPAFFVKEYFTQIFKQSGLTGNYRYTVTGSTAFIDEFNKAIVPNNDSDFSYTQTPQVIFALSRTGLQDKYNADSQTYRDNPNNRSEYNHLIAFTSTVSGGTGQKLVSTAVTNGQIINFNNRINTTITAKLSYQFTQFHASNNANPTVRFQCLYRTDSTKQFVIIGEVTKTYPSNQGDEFVYINPVDTFNLSLTNQFEVGSQMAFVAYLDVAASNSAFVITVMNADMQIGSNAATSLITVNLNDPVILVGQNTQTIKQVDFLKSFINMFNLYCYPDPADSRHIIFMPYNDYYSNFSIGKINNTALDWTNKIDNAEIKQTPVSEIFNLYKFTFKDDSDFLSKIYKDKYGDTYGNLILTGSTYGSNKSVDLIFGSTPISYYNGKNYAQLWELDTNNLKKLKVTAPRILFYNGVKKCPTYEIGVVALNTTNNSYFFTSIDTPHIDKYTFNIYSEANEFTTSVSGEFVDLTFGIPNQVYYTSNGLTSATGKRTLYERYYQDQITELLDSNTRVIECSAYLNENDIHNLDFQKPIFFDSVLGHNYFKLLSVQYSNKNEPSIIKLQTAYIKDNHVAFPGYPNNIYSSYFKKSGCGTGYTGESILYVVDAGSHISLVSQVDADSMAITDANTNGQGYSNIYGICVYSGTSFGLGYSGSYPIDAINAATGITTTSGYSYTPGTGITYYISATGSTGNTGTSPASAWSLAKVGSFAFNGGDSILFQKGDTFTGTTTFTRSGSNGNPILFDLYGTATNNPVLDGLNASGNSVVFLNGASYVTIKNLTVQNSTNSFGIIRSDNGSNLNISNCNISNGVRGINVRFGGSNLNISNNFISNFSDPNISTNGGGNAIQLNRCTGASIVINYNKCYTVVTPGSATTQNVGDVLNLYKCQGTSGSPIQVYYNQIRGGSSNTVGYAGLVLGDVGGAWQDAQHNTFINSGRVGAQIQGGTHINFSNNIIYTDVFPYTSVGMAFANYSGAASSAITMSYNKINFYASAYGHIFNKKWDTSTAFQPSGWTTNTADSTADAGAYGALLPNPLWAGSPWNTSGSTTTTVTATSIYYTNTGNLNLNSIIFNTLSGNTLRGNYGFYSDGNNYWQVDTRANLIASGTSASLSGVTYLYDLVSGSTQYATCQIANNDSTQYRPFYLSEPVPRVNTKVYISGTTIVSDGWYSDRINSYQVSAGVIASVFYCSSNNTFFHSHLIS